MYTSHIPGDMNHHAKFQSHNSPFNTHLAFPPNQTKLCKAHMKLKPCVHPLHEVYTAIHNAPHVRVLLFKNFNGYVCCVGIYKETSDEAGKTYRGKREETKSSLLKYDILRICI